MGQVADYLLCMYVYLQGLYIQPSRGGGRDWFNDAART